MRPTLFSFSFLGIPFDFHSYTIAMAIAFLVGTLFSVRENFRRAQPFDVTPIGGIWVFIGALLGAKIYWLIQYGNPASALVSRTDVASPALPWGPLQFLVALATWQGGLVFFGGLLGGMLAAIGYLVYKRVPLLPMGDIVFPYVALAHCIARLGCFLNGCCYGKPTDVPWGIEYPPGTYLGTVKFPGQHIHPTQLYESAGLFVIFIILRVVYSHRPRTGTIVLLYPFLYGVLRFTDEFFRGDSARPLLGLTASQFVALGLIFLPFLMVYHVRRIYPDTKYDAGASQASESAT